MPVRTALAALEDAVFASPLLPRSLMREFFVVASIATGSRFCQAHGAIEAAGENVPIERVQALWDFESSALFNDAERAAFRVARDSALTPHSLKGHHSAEMRKHWNRDQCEHFVWVGCLAAWRNRRAVLEAPLLDRQSLDWARAHLGAVGWTPDASPAKAHPARRPRSGNIS